MAETDEDQERSRKVRQLLQVSPAIDVKQRP